MMRLGKARSTRYFLRRKLRGALLSAPAYAVDPAGITPKSSNWN